MKLSPKALRLVCLLLGVMMIVGMFAGCGKSNDVSSNDTSSDDTAASKPDDSGKDKSTAEPVTLKYMTWYPPQNIMNEIIEKFENKYPNIDVKVEINEPGAHCQKLPIALASGEKIDVMGVMVDIAKQVKPYLANVDEVMTKSVGDDWESSFKDGVLDWSKKICESDDVLILPTGSLASPVVYYNATIFEELGLEVPKTVDELKNIIQTIKQKKPDMMPLAFRGKLYWLHSYSAFGLWGQKKPQLLTKVNNGDIKYNSPEVKEMAQWWLKLFEEDIISKDTLDVDNTKVNEIFYGGDAAMLLHGSWMAGLLSKDWREKNGVEIDRIGAFMFPSIEGSEPTTAAIYDVSLGLNKNSKNLDEAAKLFKFILLEEGLDVLVNNFLVFPSKKGYEVDTSNFVDEPGKNGFDALSEGIANPNNPERYLSGATKEFGRVLQAVTLGEDIQKVLDEFQKEFESGKY